MGMRRPWHRPSGLANDQNSWMPPSGNRWARSDAAAGDKYYGDDDECHWFPALLAHQLPYPAAAPDLI